MIHARFPEWIPAFVLVLLSAAGTASADTIVVQSGGWTFDYGDGPTPIVLTGDGFSLSFFPTSRNDFIGLFGCLASCAPGTTIDLSSHMAAPFVSRYAATDYYAGASQFNGMTYPALYLDGDLWFNAFDPPAVVSEPGSRRYTGSFALSGALTAYTDSSRTGPPAFAVDLAGRGQVTLGTYSSDPAPAPIHTNYGGYRFESSPAATPEPATLLLFGGGLIASGVRARRLTQRRGRQS
jgi:hypothetical protein